MKVTAVKGTANGWTNGDVYFGSDLGGIAGIGWISADGSRSNLTWGVLTNGVVTNALPLRGGLCFDQTGVFSNQIVAIASDSSDQFGDKGVWLVSTNQSVTLLTQIFTRHLEGAITLTNDPAKWGPWAGKILTGDEAILDEKNQPRPVIYAIETNGFVTSFPDLGIAPEDFDIIQPTQDLYCVVFNTSNSADGQIWKLPSDLLTNYVEDLLITQAGEPVGVIPPKLFIVHWNNAIGDFEVRSISIPSGFQGHFEHVSFAPINIPSIQ